MTEEEKDKLRQAKADVTDLLANIDIDRYRLTEIDSRLDSYVRMVAGNPDAHNLYEQLAVQRFFYMCDKYGINATEVWQFADFYESLYFPVRLGSSDMRLPRYSISSLRVYLPFGRVLSE